MFFSKNESKNKKLCNYDNIICNSVFINLIYIFELTGSGERLRNSIFFRVKKANYFTMKIPLYFNLIFIFVSAYVYFFNKKYFY